MIWIVGAFLLQQTTMHNTTIISKQHIPKLNELTNVPQAGYG